MRASVAIVCVLVVAVAAAIAFVPATLLDRRVAAATGGALRLSDAEGTIWRGRGALGDARGTWHVPIGWQLSPWSVLRGAVDVELMSPSDPAALQGRLVAENDGADLRNVVVRAPAALLNTLAGIKLPVAPGGELALDAPQFRYRPNRIDGAFDIRWERARVATAASALDLGTVTAHFVPQGTALAGTIANVGGDARVAGDVNLGINSVALRGTIAPNRDLAPDIVRMLSALGPTDASGVVHLQWSGRP